MDPDPEPEQEKIVLGLNHQSVKLNKQKQREYIYPPRGQVHIFLSSEDNAIHPQLFRNFYIANLSDLTRSNRYYRSYIYSLP